MLNYKRLLFVQRIPVMMFATIDRHAAQIEQKCFLLFACVYYSGSKMGCLRQLAGKHQGEIKK